MLKDQEAQEVSIKLDQVLYHQIKREELKHWVILGVNAKLLLKLLGIFQSTGNHVEFHNQEIGQMLTSMAAMVTISITERKLLPLETLYTSSQLSTRKIHALIKRIWVSLKNGQKLSTPLVKQRSSHPSSIPSYLPTKVLQPKRIVLVRLSSMLFIF